MKTLILLTILLQVNLGYTQVLGIKETVEYVNKVALADTEPETYKASTDCMLDHYNKLTLTQDGYIIIEKYSDVFDCKFSNKEKSYLLGKELIHYSDIDLEKITINSTGWIELYCKNDENCVQRKEGHYPYYNVAIIGDITDNYNRKKIVNAIKYLVTLLNESPDYRRNDLDDPFAPNNFKNLNIQSDDKSNLSKILLKTSGSVNEIPVQFGAYKRNFILDSGAGEVQINEAVENKLIEMGIIKKTDYLIPGLYVIANGSIESCRRVKLPSLKVGTFTVKNVTASIGKGESPLLLGNSFLNHFTKWHIDNSGPYLVLEK